jgi:hypothetical protein
VTPEQLAEFRAILDGFFTSLSPPVEPDTTTTPTVSEVVEPDTTTLPEVVDPPETPEAPPAEPTTVVITPSTVTPTEVVAAPLVVDVPTVTPESGDLAAFEARLIEMQREIDALKASNLTMAAAQAELDGRFKMLDDGLAKTEITQAEIEDMSALVNSI